MTKYSLFLEMCETYDALGPEDKFLIECAPNLGSSNIEFVKYY